MMRYLAILILVLPMNAFGAMSDSQAAVQAWKIWGKISWIGTGRDWGATNWTKLIGFRSPGCKQDPTIVASGFNTYDTAFAALPPDKGIQGTYSGQDMLVVDGTDDVNGDIIIAVQVLIDNTPLGMPVNVGMLPWSVSVPWDTRTATNGPHVVCMVELHPNGGSARSDAAVVMVAN